MLFPVAIPARSIHSHHVNRSDLKAKSSMHFAISNFLSLKAVKSNESLLKKQIFDLHRIAIIPKYLYKLEKAWVTNASGLALRRGVVVKGI